MGSLGVLNRYRSFLPVTERTPIITLGEGDTPLVKSESIGKELGCELYYKLEGCNPTGSFKDRGMVVAIAKAIEAGYTRIICASTGNTSASAAAYGARYNVGTIVVVPSGEITVGKLVQAMVYGARILAVNGKFDDALRLVRSCAESFKIGIVNSINPYRIEGQKTASFEIVEVLKRAPDIHCLPVGNAGNITAYWKGYTEAKAAGMCSNTPVMIGFQAEGAAPIVRGKIVESPQTIATAIKIGNPASWHLALEATRLSNGMIRAVSDIEIVKAYLRLAREEGIFCEPAAAISVAGLLKLPQLGVNLSKKVVVCVLTGNGLKDYATAESRASVKLEYIEPDIDAIKSSLSQY